MPIRKVLLNKFTAVQVANILGLCSPGKTHTAHLRALHEKILASWPELNPEKSVDGGVSISAEDLRSIDFTPQEQTAVAHSLADLAVCASWPPTFPGEAPRKTCLKDFLSVRAVATVMGSGIVKFFDAHTSGPCDPFEGEWDEDEKLLASE